MSESRIPQCFLHIGSEKTGTTSIQRFFAKNRDAILQDGICYPRSLAHRGKHVHQRLTDAVKKKATADWPQMVAEFREEYAEAAAAGATTMVISSEFFHSHIRSPDAVARIREFLEPFFDRTRVIYYARRQDQLIASMYTTAVKGGYRTDRDVLGTYNQKGHHYFDHLQVCDLWAGAFGRHNMICRIFDRDKLFSRDVLDDFSNIVGLSIRDSWERQVFNESLSFDAINALLLINGSHLRDNDKLRQWVVEKGRDDRADRIPMLSRGEAKQFLARFEESNRGFFSKYVDASLATCFNDNFEGFREIIPAISAEQILSFVFAPEGL